jgi:uncharacterized protein
MRVTVSGATGLIGSRLVAALKERGDEVTVLSRNPERAREALGVEAAAWDPTARPAPVEALSGRDGVVHLAGENIAQRWTEESRRRISESRTVGTANLVAGLRDADPRPGVLVSASGISWYGPRDDEQVDEDTPAVHDDFLTQLAVDWEQAADEAAQLGLRVVKVRTGIALAESGGALSKMLLPFKLGVGGPVAGGRQYMSWIHVDDVVGMYLAALGDERWSGPVNATAPEPVTNRDFSKALGRALHRPAVLPVPGLALQLLYGDMSMLVTTGQRVIPKRASELGYTYAHPDLDEALRSALD